jgi:tRNA(Ile)-lysidine synthase
MQVEEHFFTTVQNLAFTKKFCIALSGGLDSRVLLHLFSKLLKMDPSFHLRAIHVHHGLSPRADDWAQLCQVFCISYPIPLEVVPITITKQPQQSLEAIARNQRYQALQERIQENEALVTAHQENDQAETLLLQLFRGAGPRGLAAMPAMTSFGKGYLFRPLLTATRTQLENYARAEGLEWIEDESNANQAFDRNFIRHELLPLIQTRWPKITANLSRAAQHCAEADSLLKHHVLQAFQRVFNAKDQSLSILGILSLENAIQNQVLRHWLSILGFSLPSTKKLLQIKQEILRCRQDARPLICWEGIEMRRYGDSLYILAPLGPHDPAIVIPWDLKEDLALPNGLGILSPKDLEQHGLELEQLTGVTIRFRQGGEKCRLKNRDHSHCLKKLFQEWQVPPWLRNRVPLLYSKEELRAVIGYTLQN